MEIAVIGEVNAAEFRENAGDLLSRVQSLQASVVIRENGEPVAVLMDARSYRSVLWQRFEELAAPMREGFKDVPEEEGLAIIDEMCRSVRHSG